MDNWLESGRGSEGGRGNMCHMLCLDEHLYMENEKRKTK